jgi:hypothetical protein
MWKHQQYKSPLATRQVPAHLSVHIGAEALGKSPFTLIWCQHFANVPFRAARTMINGVFVGLIA